MCALVDIFWLVWVLWQHICYLCFQHPVRHPLLRGLRAMFKVRQKPWQGDLAVTGNVRKGGGRREGIKQAWIAIPVANLFGPVSVHRSALQLLAPLAASHKVNYISRISRWPHTDKVNYISRISRWPHTDKVNYISRISRWPHTDKVNYISQISRWPHTDKVNYISRISRWPHTDKVNYISRISRCPTPTHKRLKRMLFIRTKHKVWIFGVIPSVKLQSDT